MNKNLITLTLAFALSGCNFDQTSADEEVSATQFAGINKVNIGNQTAKYNNKIFVTGEDTFIAQTDTATLYGSFSITTEGAWNFELNTDNNKVAELALGSTLTDIIQISSADGTSTTIVITITGVEKVEIEEESNSPATFKGDLTANITADDSNDFSGTINVSDDDQDEGVFQAQNSTSTTYGSFSITADGVWNFQLDVANVAVAGLATGETLMDDIQILSADGTAGAITITINGSAPVVNTPATINGDLSATVAKDALENVVGAITIIDNDQGQELAQVQSNFITSYGSFSINESGAWTYTLTNSNTDVLALTDESDTLTDAIAITSVDGTTTDLIITITGVTIDGIHNGFSAIEGGNHVDGYTDAVPAVVCTQTVTSVTALETAADTVVAGDTICLADGTYTGDFELRVNAVGTAKEPIIIAAENPGSAIITGGEISVRLGGEHVVIQGFVFRDGESGSSIINFKQENECHNCRVTEVSIIDMDGGDYGSSKWIEYYGQYNRIDHSWFSGKESRGALLVLPRWIDEATFASSGFPEDRAQIDYNYFGDRPPAFGKAYATSGDNEYEGVRLGLSTTHSAPSFSTVEHNYFERIQGEAEVISNKAANNTIRHNTVRDSYGSIVTRHGAEADISNNFIIGDDNPYSGGIRLVDDGHVVTNNYIEGARYLNSNWNGGIVLTTGDGSGDTENGYQDVENVFIAHNTIVDSVNSLHVYGGRESTAPTGIYFVNNIIADAIGPVIRSNGEDMPVSSTYAGNYVFGAEFSDNDDITEASTTGFNFVDAMLAKGSDGLYRPTADSPDLSASDVATGDFVLPSIDMDGDTRTSATTSGADEDVGELITLAPLSASDVGPRNYTPAQGKIYIEKVDIINHDFDSGDLTGWTDNTGSGASITTSDDAFSRGNSLAMDSDSASISQTVALAANTNYTLSAFMKGSAKLSIAVGSDTYAAERTASSYGFSTVSFNSGAETSATITATVDDLVVNKAAILNSDFDDGQDDWTVVEGTGIGQVQDSSNSAGGADGSIKFKYNIPDDSGTPNDPYIAQTVTVEPNTNYSLSIYNLYKSDNDDSSIVFGASTAADITDGTSWIASKDSIYSALKNVTSKGDDSFYQDTLSFNSGDNTELTVFAQFKSSTGAEIRVDKFELSYEGAPDNGTEAFFDSIRLVSHPLSPAESIAADN